MSSITTSTSPTGGSTTSTAKALWSSSWPMDEKAKSNLTAIVDVVKTGPSPRLGAASALSDDPYLDLAAGSYLFDITFEIDSNLDLLDPIIASNPLELLNESTEDITFVVAEGLIGPQGLNPVHPIWRFALGLYPDKSIFVQFSSDPAYTTLTESKSDSDIKNALFKSLDRSVAGSIKLKASPYKLFTAKLTSNQNFSYSEQASAYSVPTPLPLAGVALAFKFSRRLRARVRIRGGCK